MLSPRAAVKSLSSIALFLLVSGDFLPAAVLTDPFTDNNRSGGATDNSGISWYDRSANAVLQIANDNSGIGSGLALQWDETSTAGNRGFLGVFDAGPITLSLVGDSISISFDFRFTSAPDSSFSGLTFGFYNNNGTATTADDNNTSDNDVGYRADIGTGTTSTISLNRETNSSGSPGGLGTTTSGDTTVLAISGASPVNINDALKHSASFTITRTASGINLSVSVDNVLRGTASHNTSPTTTFHEIVFSQNSTTDYFVDNVVVTIVPEPSPALLSLSGALGIWLASRRRKLVQVDL